jgi:hypothetical protein
LAPTSAQDNHTSGGLSHSTTSKHSDGNTQCTSDEPGADTLTQPSEEDGEHDCGESGSELERDMLLAFERQENLLPAYTTSSLYPHHTGSEFAHTQVDQEPDQNGHSHGGLEGLRHASPLCFQPQKEADVVAIPLGQQPQDKVVDEARVVEDGYGESEQPEPAEKRPCQARWSPGLQNGESEIRSLPAKLRYMSNSTFRKRLEVPPQHRSRYLLRSIKSGPSKAFSNAQGSGMRQRIISSSNCRVCHSALAYQLKYAMMRMCQQHLRRVLRHLVPKSRLQRRDLGQGSGGSQKMTRD